MWWKRKPQDFKAEIDAHLQLEADELRAEGLPPADAEFAAKRSFGNRTSTEERFYESSHWMLGQHLVRDIRFAARVLMKDAKFSVVAVLGLALGIGVSTAIFALVKYVTPEVKEVSNPESYVGVERGKWNGNFLYSEYRYFQEHSRTLKEISAEAGPYYLVLSATSEHADPEDVRVKFESASFLSVLALRPALGRTFSFAEEQPGGPPVAMLGHEFWRKHFAGDTGVLGRTIVLNTHAVTIVGVADSQFDALNLTAVILPLELQPLVLGQGDWLLDSETTWLSVTARLQPGVTVAQAQAEADVVGNAFTKSKSTRSRPANAAPGRVLIAPGGENPERRRDRLKGVLGINAVVSMILLIACSNLANLLLARSAVRRREIGVRLSLGASRARVVCQLLTESLLLASAGGAVGLVFSFWLARSLFIFVSSPGLELNLEPRVVLYGIALTLVTGLSFGLGPALAATRTNVARALHSDGLAGTLRSPSRKIWSPRNLLVVIPLAISLMLLIGAAFMLRMLHRANVGGPVFDTSRVIGMSFRLGAQGYDEAKTVQFQEELRERISVMPGVASVALASVLPLNLSAIGFCPVLTEGVPISRVLVICNVVSPGYFETLGVPVVRGRTFSSTDREGSAPVAIVSQDLARKYWPNEDPIGKRIRPNNGSTFFEIVGVASDLENPEYSLTPLFASLYIPEGQGNLLAPDQRTGVIWNGARNAQYQVYQKQFLIRASGETARVKAVLRQAVRAADPALWVSIQTIEEKLEPSRGGFRYMSFLFSAFGFLALVMASVGIYALLSYAVSQRTHEIGIRMALGAHRRDILSLVMGKTVILITCGIALGLAGAVVLTRIQTARNPDAGHLDAAPCILVALLLGGVSLLASYLPARKALRVDPMQALRCE